MMADSKTRVQHVFEETKKYDVALVALQLALQASEKELQNAKQTIGAYHHLYHPQRNSLTNSWYG